MGDVSRVRRSMAGRRASAVRLPRRPRTVDVVGCHDANDANDGQCVQGTHRHHGCATRTRRVAQMPTRANASSARAMTAARRAPHATRDARVRTDMERKMQCNSSTLHATRRREVSRARDRHQRTDRGRDQRCLDVPNSRHPNSRHPTRRTHTPHAHTHMDHLCAHYWFLLTLGPLKPVYMTIISSVRSVCPKPVKPENESARARVERARGIHARLSLSTMFSITASSIKVTAKVNTTAAKKSSPYVSSSRRVVA